MTQDELGKNIMKWVGNMGGEQANCALGELLQISYKDYEKSGFHNLAFWTWLKDNHTERPGEVNSDKLKELMDAISEKGFDIDYQVPGEEKSTSIEIFTRFLYPKLEKDYKNGIDSGEIPKSKDISTWMKENYFGYEDRYSYKDYRNNILSTDIKVFDNDALGQDKLEDFVLDNIDRFTLYRQKNGNGLLVYQIPEGEDFSALCVDRKNDWVGKPGDYVYAGFRDGELDKSVMGVMTERALRYNLQENHLYLTKTTNWKFNTKPTKTTEKNYAIVITPNDDVKIEKVDFNNPFAIPNLIEASLLQGTINVVRHGFVKDKMSSVMVVDDNSYLKTQTNRVGSALYFGNRINGNVLLCREELGFEGSVFKGYSHRQAESLVKWLEERIQKNNNDFKFNYDPKTERENRFVTAKNPDELEEIVENIGELLEDQDGLSKQMLYIRQRFEDYMKDHPDEIFVPDAEHHRINFFENPVENGESEGRNLCVIGVAQGDSLCIIHDNNKFETIAWIPIDYIDFDGLLENALAKKIGHKEIAESVKNILTDIATGKCQEKGLFVEKKQEDPILSDNLGGHLICTPKTEYVTFMSYDFGKGIDGKHKISKTQMPRALIKELIKSPEKIFDKIEKIISDDNQKNKTEKGHTVHRQTGSQKTHNRFR